MWVLGAVDFISSRLDMPFNYHARNQRKNVATQFGKILIIDKFLVINDDDDQNCFQMSLFLCFMAEDREDIFQRFSKVILQFLVAKGIIYLA